MLVSRILAASVAAALVGISLTGCVVTGSAVSSSTAAGCDTVTSGSASNSVSVTGTFGSAPTVSFTTPLVSQQTQATTLIHGTGASLTADSAWSVAYSMYQGDSTTALDTSGYSTDGSTTSTPLILQPSAWEANWPGLYEALQCGNVGDRIVIVMGTSDNSSMMSGLGLDTSTSLIMVVDVLNGYPDRASGAAQSVSSIFPTVTLATDGQPGISTPEGDAPTETTIGVLQKGDGATVTAGETVVAQYSGWLWSDGTQFGSTWNTGQLLSIDESTTLPGFWKAVEGQTVGSQVIVIVPPKDAYGDTANGSIPADSTLVFVVDILGVE